MGILSAFAMAFSPLGILASLSGVVGGILVGALPGLSATMAVALLIPITFGMSPHIALLMLVGVYCGAVYGSSISAILIGVPGTPSAAATWMDGYPMTKNGEASKALGGSIMGSFVGGIFSALALTLLAPVLARFALKFGPPEYFSLSIFGLSIIVSLVSKSFLKGLVSALLGLILASVGMDPILGEVRMTFDNINLMSGIPFACAIIGIFGFSQVLQLCQQSIIAESSEGGSSNGKLPSLREIFGFAPTIVRSSLIGTIIGIIPGAGTSMASFIAYNEAKRFSKHRERFGTGYLEGVIAPDTANNAVTGGSMVPMLALGVPGNGVSAIFIGALMIHGIAPGPLLFKNHGDLVNTIFLGFFVANFFMLIMGLLVAKYMSGVTLVPTGILTPMICILCVIGTYAIRNNLFDVWVMLMFGLGSYFLSKYKFSLIPFVLALILAPIAEKSFYQSLLISRGSYSIFLTKPISLVLLVFAVLSIVVPLFKKELKEQE